MKKITIKAFLAVAAGVSLLPACSGGGEGRGDSDTVADAAAEERALLPADQRMKINSVGALHRVFNDSNRYHYVHAERLGIAPIHSLAGAYFTRRPIVRISTGEFYCVDTLEHSLPYLVPEAARLLEDIGRGFVDSLLSRGKTGYRIKVTSLLRTPRSVKLLRRVNRNATDSSTHQFGTTFDISYSKFCRVDSVEEIPQEDLKNLLAEVLGALRDRGRCLIKYERHSPCFHITAIK